MKDLIGSRDLLGYFGYEIPKNVVTRTSRRMNVVMNESDVQVRIVENVYSTHQGKG